MNLSSLHARFYLTLVGVVAGLLVLSGVFSYLLFSEIFPLAESYSSTQRAIHVSESKIDYLKKIVEPGVERSSSDLDTIKSMFYAPSAEHAYDIILFIESAGKSNNVTTKITTPPSDTTATVSVQIAGSFNDIVKFLRAVENDGRLLRVDSVSLAGSGNDLTGSLTFVLQAL